MLAGAAALLLAGCIAIGVVVVGQARSLERTLSTTEDVVNANVRTLGQAQRELLRMQLVLERGEIDAAVLELQRSFVAQRMREITGTYQLDAVGGDALQQEVLRVVRRWGDDVEPLVRAVIAAPTTSPDERALAIAAIRSVEPEFLRLTTLSEADRKAQAGKVQQSADDLLSRTWLILDALAVLLVLFVTVAAFTGWWLWRSEQRRRTAQAELLATGERLRLLSEVASRTDNIVIITDAEGRTEWVNDSFVHQTGWSLEEVIGRAPGDFLQ
jgi:PAS domain-containing protein